MDSKSSREAFSLSAVASTLVVLALLYFGLILRNWRYIEDIRAMVAQLVMFGLFSGALLSVLPWMRSRSAITVFVLAACISSIAIIIHIILIHEVGFAPVQGVSNPISETFYKLFAGASVGLFGFTVLCGFHASIALSEIVITRLNNDSLEKIQNELMVKGVTAIVGLIGAVLTALLGGKGA
jgi:hypothetical protein